MRAQIGDGIPPATEQYASARSWLESRGPAILEDQVDIASTPAPTFREQVRAELIRSKLLNSGVEGEFDAVGNLLVRFPGRDRPEDGSPIVIAAHLDTVFGPETEIEIRADGDRRIGAGIADNARGLAVVATVIRALAEAGLEPEVPLVFAFTVGEEGNGNLRGVRHLFESDAPLPRPRAFIAVDGSGLRRIINRALGARRYRVTVSGPGGHSWTDWGRPNPVVAVAGLVHRLAHLDIPQDPRTTVTAARLGGGTSVNSIPDRSWIDIDIRSENTAVLDVVESDLRRALAQCVSEEEARAGPGLLADLQPIGDRPAGSVDAAHPLVSAAIHVTRSFGHEPELAISSTDANVPLALGVPAIALGGGGRSGETHTEREWFEDTDGAAGALRVLDLLAAIAPL